jgi:CcmD family protein
MGTLAMGFLAAWTAVAAYVGWLGVQQRRLNRRLDAVERREAADRAPARRRAA